MRGPERDLDLDLDERLRAALEPAPQIVRRVVDRALRRCAGSEVREGQGGDEGEAGDGGRIAARWRWPGLAAAGSLAAVVTALLLILAPRLRSTPPSCLLANRGTVFVLRDAFGVATIRGADVMSASDELPRSPTASMATSRPGSLLLITHGEIRRARR